MPRKYTHVKALEAEIVTLREAGRTRQEIADELGLTKEQIKQWVTRYNKRKSAVIEGRPLHRRGRPRKHPLTNTEEKDQEIKRLQMENELLRDFLRLVGRR